MDIETSVHENRLFKKEFYFGIFQRLFLFLAELLCFTSVIAVSLLTCNLELKSKFDLYSLFRVIINVILAIFRFIVVTMLIKSEKVKSYRDNSHEIGLNKCHELERFINGQHVTKNIAFSIFFIIQSILHIWSFISKDSVDVWWKATYSILVIIFPSLYCLILREIVNACIYLRVAFKLVNSRVSSMVKSTPTDLKPLLRCRRCYSYAVKATKSVENYFRYYITFFYLQYAGNSIMNIVYAFGDRSAMDFYWILHSMNDTALIVYLTANLISVNLLSRESLDNLNELSFLMKRPDMKYENEIFIGRILFTDVGFTFANLFTINTQFVASMLTLSLTLILALANFLYQ